jgi:cell division protease FtsH
MDTALHDNLDTYIRKLQRISKDLTPPRSGHPFKIKRDIAAIALKSPRVFLAYCALTGLFRRNIVSIFEPSCVAIISIPITWNLVDVHEAAKIIFKDKLSYCLHPDKKGKRGYDIDVCEYLEARKLIVFVHEGTEVHQDFELAATMRDQLRLSDARHYRALGRLRKCGEVTSAQIEMIARQPSERLDAIYRIGQPAHRAVSQLLKEKPGSSDAQTTRHLDVSIGFGDASTWASELVEDIRDWRDKRISWSDIDTGCLLYGLPGTGKTRFASGLALACNLRLEVSSVSRWQASGGGFLGDTLKAMYSAFEVAKQNAPCLLFIDEFDSIGNRETFSATHSSYSTQVVNALLECLDGISGREGVIVLGACNHPEKVDPGLLRSGRLEKHVHFPMPDAEARAQILAFHLPSLSSEDLLREIASRMPGYTGADIERLAREARRIARRQSRHVSIDDVRSLLTVPLPLDEEALHRVAVHEAGHAVIAHALRLGQIERVEIFDNIRSFPNVKDSMGETVINSPAPQVTTAWDAKKMITMHVAGAAAEELIFGLRSDWSSGSPDSDFAKATILAIRMLTEQGFGSSLYFLPRSVDMTRPSELWKEVELRDEVGEILREQHQRAIDILDGLRGNLVVLAEVLMKERRLNADQLEDYLRIGPKKKSSLRPH